MQREKWLRPCFSWGSGSCRETQLTEKELVVLVRLRAWELAVLRMKSSLEKEEDLEAVPMNPEMELQRGNASVVVEFTGNRIVEEAIIDREREREIDQFSVLHSPRVWKEENEIWWNHEIFTCSSFLLQTFFGFSLSLSTVCNCFVGALSACHLGRSIFVSLVQVSTNQNLFISIIQ